MTAVEASLRLDAVASGGFGISRSKMVSLIEGGNAMVNWIPVKNPAHNIEVNSVTILPSHHTEHRINNDIFSHLLYKRWVKK